MKRRDAETNKQPSKSDWPLRLSVSISSGPRFFVIAGMFYLWGIGGVAANAAEIRESREPIEAAKPLPGNSALFRLEYKLKRGQILTYDVEQQASITTQKDAFAESTHNKSTTRMHFRVLSVSDAGIAELESYIDRVRMSYHFGKDDPIEFDSDMKGPPPRGFSQIKAAIGSPLARLKVDKWGSLVSIISFRGDTKGDEQDVSDDPARNFLVKLPTEPVSIGAHWTEQIPVKVLITKNLSNTVKLLRKYELLSVENGLATISVKAEILTPVNDPQLLGQLIQRTPQGTIQMDLDQGVIVARTMKTDKTEIGIIGPKSSMRAVSELRETLVPPPVVAEKPSL